MSAEVLERPARRPDRVLRYAPGDTGVADLYRAKGDTSPGQRMVVVVHGGFWRKRYDRTHLRPLAASLADQGASVVLPQYRRLGDAGGEWPGGRDDVVALLRALPDLLDEEDAQRPVVLAGHSAGGHLAVLAALALDGDAGIEQVVSLAGVLDLRAAREDRLSDSVVDDLVAGGDPSARVPVEADPAQLPSPPVPTVLVHGTADKEVPVSYSRRYADERPGVRLVELPETGHYDLIDPAGHAGSVVAGLLLARPSRSR